MKVRLAYGKTGLDIDLPQQANVTLIEPQFLQGLPDQGGAVQRSLREPISSPALRDLVDPSSRIGVIFSDITRATPNDVILPVLLAELSHVSPADRAVQLHWHAPGQHRQ